LGSRSSSAARPAISSTASSVGSVVDFVDVYWRSYHFWAFNVADSAITIGVAIMILDMLGVGSHVSKTA
jgi:lipoprotein signal peptidase